MRYTNRSLFGAIFFSLILACSCSNKETADLLKDLRTSKNIDRKKRLIGQLVRRNDKDALLGLIDIFVEKPSSVVYRAIVEYDSVLSLPAHLALLSCTDDRACSDDDKMIALHVINDLFSNVDSAGSKRAEAPLLVSKILDIEEQLTAFLRRDQGGDDRNDRLRLMVLNCLASRFRHYSETPFKDATLDLLIEMATLPSGEQNFGLSRVALRILGATVDIKVLPVLVQSLFRQSKAHGSSFFDARLGIARFGSQAGEFLDTILSDQSSQSNSFFKRAGIDKKTRLSRLAIVLGDLHSSTAMNRLIDHVASNHARTSIRMSGILETVGRLGLTQARSSLVSLAKDQQATHICRERALDAILYIGNRGVVVPMTTIALRQADSWDLRQRAIEVAAMLSSPKQMKGIRAALTEIVKRDVSIELKLQSVKRYIELAERCRGKSDCLLRVLESERSDLDSINYAAIAMLRSRTGYLALAPLASVIKRVADDDRRIILTVVERIIGHPRTKQEDLKRLQTALDTVSKDESESKQAFLGDENQLRSRLLSIRIARLLSERS